MHATENDSLKVFMHTRATACCALQGKGTILSQVPKNLSQAPNPATAILPSAPGLLCRPSATPRPQELAALRLRTAETSLRQAPKKKPPETHGVARWAGVMGTADFSPCIDLPGFRVGNLFLTHSQVSTRASSRGVQLLWRSQDVANAIVYLQSQSTTATVQLCKQLSINLAPHGARSLA